MKKIHKVKKNIKLECDGPKFSCTEETLLLNTSRMFCPFNQKDEDLSQEENCDPLLSIKEQRALKRNQSDTKILERRERNREHAKRSRSRKRFMLDSLLQQHLALQKENMALRQLLQEKLPDKADTIYKKCQIKIADFISSSIKDYQGLSFLTEPDVRLGEVLTSSQQNLTISDPSLPDNPIVYASEGFLKLTGYKSDEVIGRNMCFLQGPATDPQAVEIIRRGIAEGRDVTMCILNYKSNGTPFWNQFFMAPLRNAQGKIVNFVGIQCEILEMSSDRLRDKLKKLPLPQDLNELVFTFPN